MRISITKKEYRLLLTMLYLSDWLMNAYKINEDEGDPAYKAFRKKLLSYHKEMEAEDAVEYSKKFDDYFETHDLEEALQRTYIQPYNDETFWDELVDRLTERDVINEVGESEFRRMSIDDRITKLDNARQRYVDEFGQNGLETLNISAKH